MTNKAYLFLAIWRIIQKILEKNVSSTHSVIYKLSNNKFFENTK